MRLREGNTSDVITADLKRRAYVHQLAFEMWFEVGRPYFMQLLYSQLGPANRQCRRCLTASGLLPTV